MKADIQKIDGYSGHGDHDDLINFPRSMSRRPARTFIVHAEMDSATALQSGLKDIGLADVAIPDRGDKVSID